LYIQLIVKKWRLDRRPEESLQAKAALIAEECVAVRLRLLTRAVTNIYNRELRPHGLTIGQMNILVAASYLGPVKQQDVCQALHLEKSTLSRDLVRMRAQGWISEAPGEDGRVTILTVTTAGKQLLEKAFPAWRKAQEETKALLGREEAAALDRLAKAVRALGAREGALARS
jgi:DNA-binding MarR family transcriptional regulator